jgi:hypothetical protein
MIGAMSFT